MVRFRFGMVSIRFNTLTLSYLKNECFSYVLEPLFACVRRHIIGDNTQSSDLTSIFVPAAYLIRERKRTSIICITRGLKITIY